MLLPAAAARRILEDIRPVPTEQTPLRMALDRVLAQPVHSPLSLPPWDNSAMDGYAVRSADLRRERPTGDPVMLHVIEEVAAGAFPKQRVGPGEAIRIFTGAPLPRGADGVIRQEHTQSLGNGRVAILDDRDAGRNIRFRGEDIEEGDEILTPGVQLGPAHLAVLASIARREVTVYRRPRVAVLATGDEIVDLDRAGDVLAGKKIASSNTYAVCASIKKAGGEPINLGIAQDSRESLRHHLERAVDADLLVTTAGVSVGESDYVRSVLTELGAEIKFWRIAMRPGAPVAFGTLGVLPWIGLPGNPVSTMVTFELFVRPTLRRLAGHTRPFRRTIPVRVGESIKLGPTLRHFLRIVLEEGKDGPVAKLTGPQGSGILTSMVRATALLIVPEDQREVSVGDVLTAIRLDDPTHVMEPPF